MKVLKSNGSYKHTFHNITQRRGPLEYNSGKLTNESKFESPYIIFRAFDYYIPRTHKTRDEHLVMLCYTSIVTFIAWLLPTQTHTAQIMHHTSLRNLSFT